jgi:GWxTD domain-containing protein
VKKSPILLFILCALSFISGQQDLLPAHKEWLELVSPIITKVEKEVFLSLKTAEERNRFIQFFWKQRDPLPDTSQNEFYREYMKRVQFADASFGHETAKRGSQTERGHFYLLLGPPLERTSYTTHSQLLPMELWYYRGEVQYGLPAFFYLIFYQPQGLGEYRLYHPGIEGPERLIIHTSPGQSINRRNAFNVIKDISVELANASLSYLPGERDMDISSLSSETIISNVYSVPEKKFSDTYARSYLALKDFVETEYTHNFVESNFSVKAFKNDNQFFLHWALEPEKVNFSFHNERYYAAYQLILRMEDAQGNPILEKEEEIPLQITPEQYRKHERQLLSFQDVLPVITGKHKIFILLKNKTAKDFTSHQREILIPEEGGESALSELLLYHGREKSGGQQRQSIKAFAFEGFQYLINTQNNFLPQENLGVYCQGYNLKDIESKWLLIEIFSVNSQTPVQTEKKPLQETLGPDSTSIESESIPLSSLNPGYYHVILSIIDDKGMKILSQKGNFIILSISYPVIPWAFSKQHGSFPNPEHLSMLASQYFMTQKYDKALSALEQSLKIKDDPNAWLLKGKILYALGRFEDSLSAVEFLYKSTQNRETAKLMALNYFGLRDWAKTLVYLEKLLEEALEISVMNLAAECYLNLNQPEKALPLIQKSLELDPNQDKVKELEKRAKRQLTEN